MLKSLLALSTILLAGNFAQAGAANASINCKSESGRTQIQASFPVDFDTAAMKITVDGKSQSYVNEQLVENLKLNGNDANVEYPGHKVVAIESINAKKSFSMKTEELSIQSVGHITRKNLRRADWIIFKATVTGSDPRSNGTKALPPGITVECHYDYHI